VKIYFAGPLFTPYERGFIDECAARLRGEGFDVFVPHEHELAQTDTTPAWIFEKDMQGLGPADAVLALLDGPMIDDGTACEIGIFYALQQSDPAKKGVVGLLTDLRGTRGESNGVNLFVEGCIEASGGEIVHDLDAAIAILRRWSD
jgi:nucleoside 2-deoxyribosyltransferase